MNIKRVLTDSFPFFIGIPALLWQVIFFYIPLAFIVVSSFKSFSFTSYYPFFSSLYTWVYIRTFVLAFGTAVSCLAVAYPLSYWIAFNGGRWKNVFLFFLFVPFWTNFLLHVYAWMFVLNREGVINTILLHLGIIAEPLHLLNNIGAVWFLMVYCYLPFMILPIYSSLEKFDTRLCEASYDLGGTWSQTLWRIIIPVTWPGIRSGLFLVIVTAFGEFAIPELMSGDKTVFVGNVITYYTLSASTASLGSAFTLLSSLVLIVFIGILYFGGRFVRALFLQRR